MKIKIISVDNLEGQEITIKNILAVRFVFDENTDNWIDVASTKDTELSVRGMFPLIIQPNVSNHITVKNDR